MTDAPPTLDALHRMFEEGDAGEAIRLTRRVRAARPQDPEVAGLLALMLLTEARRPAGTDERGRPVDLAEQDRSRWDPRLLVEGAALVEEAIGRGAVGAYQVQAAIAAAHGRAARAEDTDWHEIAAWYAVLERLSDDPRVAVERAAAVARAELLDQPPGGGPA